MFLKNTPDYLSTLYRVQSSSKLDGRDLLILKRYLFKNYFLPMLKQIGHVPAHYQ